MSLTKFATLAAGAVALSGCAAVLDFAEKGRTYASHVAVEMTLAECVLPLSERQKNAQAVATLLAEKGSPAKFALDCDGDGKPDF